MRTRTQARPADHLKRARGPVAWFVASAINVFSFAEVLAQSATNVATVALDAFGEKVGSEQIGLYSEQQVRGFSLQDSGNYRIDGAYFIRSANITDAMLDGVTIRVGINALSVDFPAPSGIVEYRMSRAAPGARAEVELAWRDYGGHALFLRGDAATADEKYGVAYGASIFNDTASDGAERRPRHLAFVPAWTPNDRLQVKGLVTFDWFNKESGDYAVAVNGNTLPPTQPHPNQYAVDWGRIRQLQQAWGLVAQYALSDSIALQSSFVVTDYDRNRGDFTGLTLDANGTGTASAVRTRPIHTQSRAAETRMSWQVSEAQRLFGTLRRRHSSAQVRAGVPVALGFVDQRLGIPITPAPPDPVAADPTRDHTVQFTGGLGYEIDVTPSLWARAAIQRTHYNKEATPPGGLARGNVVSPWLYEFAATYTPTDALTFFATTVRGLEESGTAPNNAANRNEVLPAVMATQYELGLGYRLNGGITFISSLFAISKATPGIDTLNVYRLVGQARHRGLELSLTGMPTCEVNVVAGVALLDAARSGELVDRGILAGKASGIPAVTALLNLTYQVPLLADMSIDSQINYTSKRLLNPRNGLHSPAFATLDLDTRYVFSSGETPAVIRARIGNVFDEDAWHAGRSETLSRTSRRAFRISLTTTFDSEG